MKQQKNVETSGQVGHFFSGASEMSKFSSDKPLSYPEGRQGKPRSPSQPGHWASTQAVMARQQAPHRGLSGTRRQPAARPEAPHCCCGSGLVWVSREGVPSLAKAPGRRSSAPEEAHAAVTKALRSSLHGGPAPWPRPCLPSVEAGGKLTKASALGETTAVLQAPSSVLTRPCPWCLHSCFLRSLNSCKNALGGS